MIITTKATDITNSVATLMHLTEGQTSEMEPHPTYKNAPRQSVCIALLVDREANKGFPSANTSNYSKLVS